MTIDFLADHRDCIPLLAAWYEAEWAPYYAVDGPGDAAAELAARCNRDRLPAGLVAVDNDDIVGVVALDLDTATGLSPSVVGLLVRVQSRGRGIAGRLLQAATDLARELGERRLWVSTSSMDTTLRRLGWQASSKTVFMNDEPGVIYVRTL